MHHISYLSCLCLKGFQRAKQNSYFQEGCLVYIWNIHVKYMPDKFVGTDIFLGIMVISLCCMSDSFILRYVSDIFGKDSRQPHVHLHLPSSPVLHFCLFLLRKTMLHLVTFLRYNPRALNKIILSVFLIWQRGRSIINKGICRMKARSNNFIGWVSYIPWLFHHRDSSGSSACQNLYDNIILAWIKL